MTSSDSRGSRPAFTNDDLPHPDGPQINPTEKVFSASFSSMRVFQKRMLSGRPSRSRGPGSSSKKKSASCASKDRNPLGTILIVRASVDGGVSDRAYSKRRPSDRRRLLLDEVLQIIGKVFGCRVAITRSLGERFQTDAFQFLRNRIVDLPRRLRLFRRDQKERTRQVGARNGFSPVSNS